MVPSLYAGLRRHGWLQDLPADFLDYLSWIHEANAAQNRRIHDQIIDLGQILGGAGVAFVLLKGGNWLVEAEGEIGDRQLTDIDLVVAPDAWSRAIGALEGSGFRAAAPRELYARHFHHVPLARATDAVTVEVHRHLGWQRHLLSPEEVIAASVPLQDGSYVRIMHPMHRFIFGCLHAQLQNMGHAAGVFGLRDLLDIQNLLERKADDLDWPAIAAFGRERGIYPLLALPLRLAGRLLGIETPEPFVRSRAARVQAIRCLAQRWLDPAQDFGSFAVKMAWLMDARRHAYERNCEEASWAVRQALIARGRFDAVLGAVTGRRRKLAAASCDPEGPQES